MCSTYYLHTHTHCTRLFFQNSNISSRTHSQSHFLKWANNSGQHHVYVCVCATCSVCCVSTRQCVLCALDVVQYLPLVLILDPSQTLVVSFSVLQDVVVDLTVLYRHPPDNRHCIVHHHTVLNIDFWSSGHWNTGGPESDYWISLC